MLRILSATTVSRTFLLLYLMHFQTQQKGKEKKKFRRTLKKNPPYNENIATSDIKMKPNSSNESNTVNKEYKFF